MRPVRPQRLLRNTLQVYRAIFSSATVRNVAPCRVVSIHTTLFRTTPQNIWPFGVGDSRDDGGEHKTEGSNVVAARRRR